jgi:hypothetical protein
VLTLILKDANGKAAKIEVNDGGANYELVKAAGNRQSKFRDIKKAKRDSQMLFLFAFT